MVEYYELKAVDAFDSPNTGGLKADRKSSSQSETDSITKNIKIVEKEQKKKRQNLNDSREHDFEGFEEGDFSAEQDN